MKTPMFLLLGLAAAHASAQGDPLTRLKQGQPTPVARLIERIVPRSADAYGGARAEPHPDAVSGRSPAGQ